ncbi:hypothetical protein [Chenggangzhangella methanolivorans]|uniref:Uncharacterized protein n=1 Tax=Chenggangzhangella methanolivorans TaxID=1437009 RepID=A0A9E6R6S1_9HYPH|nr:hypothetical protein [Chenggangzhangella methanolivorans]QZN99275.1 hypothetical protein K6K41_21135 [Chenggangzhangella methanolivorans]
MTDASGAAIDYAKAIAEASAYLATRSGGGHEAARSRWGLWASLRPSEDLRYPVPELDPTRR